MSRRVDSFDVRVSDVIAFDAWSDEQKAIARAAVAYEAKLDEAYDEGFEEGKADGIEIGRADGFNFARADIDNITDRIQLFRQSIATTDTRYSEIGGIIAALRNITKID